MRQNTRDCLAALRRGKSYSGRSGAIHTDGRIIKSYGVVIATPDPNDPETFLVTEKKYSHTTTVQTNGVTVGLLAEGWKVRTVGQEEVNQAASQK